MILEKKGWGFFEKKKNISWCFWAEREYIAFILFYGGDFSLIILIILLMVFNGPF